MRMAAAINVAVASATTKKTVRGEMLYIYCVSPFITNQLLFSSMIYNIDLLCS